jgi:putative ABC transport system substrate-binding protein
MTDARVAAQQLNWKFREFGASTDEELTTSFEAMSQQKVAALHLTADAFFTTRLARIVALAAKYVIPASYFMREFVIAGGLMSYGPDVRESSRVAGTYVGRILKGRTARRSSGAAIH